MNFCEAANRSVFCNGNFDDEYHLPTVTLIMAVIFSLLSVATALENNLILVALRRDRCLHPPSKLLLCNLTITDLCTALISQPVSAAVSLARKRPNWWPTMSFGRIHSFSFNSDFLRFISDDCDCYFCGSTHGTFVRNTIQTNDNWKTNPCCSLSIVDPKHSSWCRFFLEHEGVLFCMRSFSYFKNDNLDLLLHKNLSQYLASANSRARS